LLRVVQLGAQRIIGRGAQGSGKDKWAKALAALRFHLPGLFRKEVQPR